MADLETQTDKALKPQDTFLCLPESARTCVHVCVHTHTHMGACTYVHFKAKPVYFQLQ